MVHRVFCMFRLEFNAAKSVYPLMIFEVVLAGVLGMVRRPEVAALPFLVLATFFGGTIFSIHERSHSDKLFGVLPVRRSEVVIGRYMYGLGMGLFNLALAAVAIVILWHTTASDMTAFRFLAALSGGWLFYCLAVSISYPIYFRLDFSRAYIFTMLPFMVLVVATVFVVFKGHLSTLVDAANYLSAHAAIMGWLALATGLVLLLISGVIATQLYRTKELN